MDDCCCFQSATGISSSGNATNVDLTGITAIIDANFQIYLNNSNIVSSNISNLYFNDGLLNSNISNLYYNDGLLNSNVSNLLYYNDSNISNIYYNTGYIDSNLLWWRYELLSTQAELAVTKLNVTAISTQQNILSTTVSAQGVTLAYHTGQINALEPKVENLENNTFTKEQTSNIFVTSNVLSNTSNTLANYNNLYNKPIIFTQEETSNIFITSNVFSNVLSNTSNTLANYNNLYNKPIIFTQEETSNIFVTSNVLSNTSNILANYNNLYNKPIIFTQEETSNIFVTSNVLSNTSNILANYNNLYNKPDVYTKTEIDTSIYTITQTDNTFTTLTQSNLLYLDLKNDFTNNLNIIDNKNKWVADGSNLYTLDYNVGIGKSNANYKVDINGSLSSTDYRFNDKQLFSLLPTDSPTFNSGISTQISSNQYYISYTQSDLMILNKSYTVDILIVGAGGRGGSSSFAGGGGAGEVIYIPNYILPQGVYNITIGIDSATPANRISKLYYQPTFTDLITANGGGDGGSVIRTYSIERRYPPKLYNSVTARTSTTFNGQASFKTTMTLDTSGITYGSGVYDVWFSTIFTTSGYDGHLCFNYVENATTGQWATITTQYSTTSPFSYSGTRYLVESTYKGEFICIKLPVAIALTSYSIVAVNSTEGAGRAPKNFRLYASNNGTSWTTLQTITGATYTTRVYNNTGLSANTTLYSYYGIVINQIIGSGTTSGITQIAEWILNGKEYFVNYINDTSGGSGGGGSGGADAYITNQTGSVAGSPYNVTYSKLNAGADGINANGGNGGSALVGGRYTDPISGIQVGAGGTGATASSTPVTKINYGDGGDGNSGLGRQGIIIMKFTSSDIITKFLEYADYNKLFNKPNLLSKEETSNIFITSNVLSNTSNTLANYNNLYNRPIIFTQSETSNIFVTSNVLSNTSNTLANYNNLYNRPINFQTDWNSTVINRPNALTNISNIFMTSNIANASFYNKTEINTEIKTNKLLINKPSATYFNSQFEVNQNLFVYQGDLGETIRLKTGSSNFMLMTGDDMIKISSRNNLFINAEVGNIVMTAININNPATVIQLTASGSVQLNAPSIFLDGDIITNGGLAKKVPKYFTTSRIASFNGINCLAYDIDLSLITKKVAINIYEHRKFRIYIIHSNGRLDFQYAPKLFDIHLTTYNGISAYCIEDRFGVTQLDTVDRTYTFYKNTIDKITFIAPTGFYGSSPITLYYIVEDLLSN
jgi:hypothetical protein